MLFVDRLRLARRRNWDRVDATFLDSRFVAFKGGTSENPRYQFQLWEYMVEVPGPGGAAPVRLTFEEKSFKVRSDLQSGDVVPVVVNAKRTKAMFDLSDPRVDNGAYLDERERRRREADEHRFEERLAGRDPAPESEEDLI